MMSQPIQRPYKERAPAETIAAIRKILTEVDLLPDESEFASPYPGLHSMRLSLDGARRSFSANGKGRSPEFCLASAYGEFVERLQNGLFTRVPRTLLTGIKASFGFYYAPDERYLAVEQLLALPNDVLADLVWHNGAERDIYLRHYAERAQTNGAPGVVAVPFYSTGSRQIVHLPVNPLLGATSANGMAAGNTLPEAIFQACCELLERWAAAEVFHRQLTPPSVTRAWLTQFPGEYAIIKAIEATGKYRVTVKDFSAGLRIPAVGVIIENTRAGTYALDIGCDTSFQIALSRCLSEMYQGQTNEDAFDRGCLPVPADDPAWFTQDDPPSRFRRFVAFRAFCMDGEGPFPAALFGREPSYPFAPDVWSVCDSHVAEVRRLVAFFHERGHNVYIRDVSFLGFPSVFVYVPGIYENGAHNVPARGRADSWPLMALDAVEGLALRLKRCNDAELFRVAEALGRLPGAYSFAKLFGLELKPGSPWQKVNVAFLLTLIHYRLGHYSEARESLQEFLDARPEECRYRYYAMVDQYLAYRAEGLPHDEASRRLAGEAGWGDSGRQAAGELEDPSQVFRFTKLPNCPDCDSCELQGECCTRETLAIITRLYPVLLRSHVEQASLAWVSPSP